MRPITPQETYNLLTYLAELTTDETARIHFKNAVHQFDLAVTALGVDVDYPESFDLFTE